MTARISHLFGSRRWRVARNGILAGLLAGTITCGYRFMIGKATEFARWHTRSRRSRDCMHCSSWRPRASALIWAAIRFSPMPRARIPQVKGYYRAILRCAATGSSRHDSPGLGPRALWTLARREGPSIHWSAPRASQASTARHVGGGTPPDESGAAAGFSAAFNAPVSGLMFGMRGFTEASRARHRLCRHRALPLT